VHWTRWDERPEQQKNTVYKAGLVITLGTILLVTFGVALRSMANPTPLPFTVVVPIAFLISVGHAFTRIGWRRLAVLLLISLVVCFGAEWLSTRTGIPFGEYTYDPARVGRTFFSVPWTVPLAWFTMLYPSLTIANLLVEGEPKVFAVGWRRLLIISFITAALMTIWDLALDPHMVHYEGAWTWRYSDQCQQERCEELRADHACVRRCKQDCTRPISPQLCVTRELFSDDETDLGACRKGRRLEPFQDQCADRCRDAAPDGDFEVGCAELTDGVEEFARREREIEGLPGGDAGVEGAQKAKILALYKDRRSLHAARNWKLDCERECCDADCERGCAAAHPIRSDDADWWSSVGGHPSRGADAMRRWIAPYFKWGYYHCIPFSNFYGWFLTSFLVIGLYGFAKQRWILKLESRAAARGDGETDPSTVFPFHRIPDELGLTDRREGEGWREGPKARIRSTVERLGIPQIVNVKKLWTAVGILIYALVAWCNVVFAHPVELSLLAVLTMGAPSLAALLRLYKAHGEQEFARDSYNAYNTWREQPDIRPLDTLQRIEIPQEILEEKRRREAAAILAQSAAQQADDDPDQGQAPAEQHGDHE